jgi:hypothetical protein
LGRLFLCPLSLPLSQYYPIDPLPDNCKIMPPARYINNYQKMGFTILQGMEELVKGSLLEEKWKDFLQALLSENLEKC